MSFKSRQKKRRYKRIETNSRKAKRTPETAARWFLTVAKKPGKCAVCGDAIKPGDQIVYRAEPREVRCVRCGSRLEDPVSRSVCPQTRQPVRRNARASTVQHPR